MSRKKVVILISVCLLAFAFVFIISCSDVTKEEVNEDILVDFDSLDNDNYYLDEESEILNNETLEDFNVDNDIVFNDTDTSYNLVLFQFSTINNGHVVDKNGNTISSNYFGVARSDENLIFTAFPDENYGFKGWFVSASKTLSKDNAVIENFRISNELTLEIDKADTLSVECVDHSGNVSYRVYDSIQAIAIEPRFERLSCSFKLSEPNTAIYTVKKNGTEIFNGENSYSLSVSYGDQVTGLTNREKRGYVWKGWYEKINEWNTKLISSDKALKYEINDKIVEFIATFEKCLSHDLDENCTCRKCDLDMHNIGNDCICSRCKLPFHADTVSKCVDSQIILNCKECSSIVPYSRKALDYIDTFKDEEKEEKWSIYMGMYPQSEVVDKELKEVLNKNINGLPNSSNARQWMSYGYYCNGIISDYMWYIDIEYDSNKYRGVHFVEYRPWKYTNSTYQDYSYQDDNGYYIGEIYWFLYEPIRWEILPHKGVNIEVKVVTDLVLDFKEYSIEQNDIYKNNWEHSAIRSWLNETFYATAFNERQKTIIKESFIDNKSTAYNGENNKFATCQEDTYDKVFLLSYEDITNNKDYSFLKNSYNNDEYRMKKVTDYAKSQGAVVENNIDSKFYGNGSWWLRSPSNFNEFSGYITEGGIIVL